MPGPEGPVEGDRCYDHVREARQRCDDERDDGDDFSGGHRSLSFPSPFRLPPEGAHLVVLGREVPCPTSITLLGLARFVKWFWVDFPRFLSSPFLGPLPSCPLLRPCFVSLVADIGGVGALLTFSACPVLTCGYCIKGLQSMSNFVIIKV